MFGKRKKQSFFEKLTGSVSLSEDYDAFDDDVVVKTGFSVSKKKRFHQKNLKILVKENFLSTYTKVQMRSLYVPLWQVYVLMA